MIKLSYRWAVAYRSRGSRCEKRNRIGIQNVCQGKKRHHPSPLPFEEKGETSGRATENNTITGTTRIASWHGMARSGHEADISESDDEHLLGWSDGGGASWLLVCHNRTPTGRVMKEQHGPHPLCKVLLLCVDTLVGDTVIQAGSSGWCFSGLLCRASMDGWILMESKSALISAKFQILIKSWKISKSSFLYKNSFLIRTHWYTLSKEFHWTCHTMVFLKDSFSGKYLGKAHKTLTRSKAKKEEAAEEDDRIISYEINNIILASLAT